jgi:hypothetical protein
MAFGLSHGSITWSYRRQISAKLAKGSILWPKQIVDAWAVATSQHKAAQAFLDVTFITT